MNPDSFLTKDFYWRKTDNTGNEKIIANSVTAETFIDLLKQMEKSLINAKYEGSKGKKVYKPEPIPQNPIGPKPFEPQYKANRKLKKRCIDE